jgi:hypothetical protein
MPVGEAAELVLDAAVAQRLLQAADRVLDEHGQPLAVLENNRDARLLLADARINGGNHPPAQGDRGGCAHRLVGELLFAGGAVDERYAAA